MLSLGTTRRFERDLKRLQKRGKDLNKLGQVLSGLMAEQRIDERYRDHALIADYRGRRECHIEGDWLLVYEVTATEIVLLRTGTHSDLFQ